MKSRIHFAWLVFAATCMISLVGFGLTMNTASLYWVPITEEFGVSTAAMSLTSTIAGLAGAVAVLVAGNIFTRVNVRVMMTVIFAVTALAYFVSAAANHMWVLYAANLVLGITKTVGVGLATPVLLANWFEKRLGLVMGIAGGLTAVGGAIFNPIIGETITTSGWRSAYMLTGVIVIVALLPFTIFITRLRRPGEHPYGYNPANAGTASAPDSGLRAAAVYRHPAFWAFIAVTVILQGAGALVQHLPTYLVAIGYAMTAASAVFSVLLIGAAVGKLAMGVLLDRFSYFGALLVMSVIGLTGWTLIGTAPGTTTMSAAMFMAGMGQAVNLTALPILVRRSFGGRDYSKIIAAISMAGTFGNSAMVYVHGLMRDAAGSYTPSLTYNVLAFVIGFTLLVYATRSGRHALREAARTEPALATATTSGQETQR